MRLVAARARDLDVLWHSADGEASLSLSEMVTRLGLPRSTMHELVGTLVLDDHLASVDGQPYRRVLERRCFEPGNVYAAGRDLTREGQLVARQSPSPATRPST